jgi:two-component system, cell cycle sensor histidine kinase and response regulator CckA
MGSSSADEVMSEPQGEQLELRLVLDARLRVDDVTSVSPGPRRVNLRSWLGRPAVELFHADDRERLTVALRGAVDGATAELSARLMLDGCRAACRVLVTPGERHIHVAVGSTDGAAAPVAVASNGQERVDPNVRLEYIGLVASRISHDFKNLLAAIFVNAEFLRRDEVDVETVREIADEILLATDRARELIEQILGHAGARTEPRSLVDVHALTREMGRLLDVSTPPTVVIHYDLQAEPSTVRGQPSRLRQLLLNFIVNASEAIGAQVGAIMIGTSSIEAGAELLGRTRTRTVPPPGPYVCLEIEDTGPGLDAQTVQKIFQPFFTTKPTGHGLGLSDCLTTVEEHGGALLLDTAPGQGARFRVLLPAAQEPTAVADEAAAPERRDLTGYCVLVIDDDDLVRSVTRRTLRARGCEVLAARDGLEGIEVFDEHHGRVDAVLLDVGMPYMKGEDVLEELRSIDPAVPVIFVSGQSEQELERSGVLGRADGMVLKPFRDGELLDALGRAFARRRARG